MNGTSRFIIQLHKTKRPHYDLTLEQNGDTRSWILPRGIPKIEEDRKIAIEERGEKGSFNEARDTVIKDGYGEGELETWDIGLYSIEAKNSIKYIISTNGKKFKGKFLLHNPGWGRWTKNKLWVLEKVPSK
jgi:bifunctional non-homologous end joining protein LigD